MTRKKTDLSRLFAKKASGEAIHMLTAYDAPTARALDEAEIDCILVGDSAANVVLGYGSTVPVSMDEMIMLTAAVVRGNQYAFVIGDMPFMSFNINPEETIRNAGRFIKDAGADAVKLEGGGYIADTVKAVVQAGIPVVGHLGLTPQTAGMIGGYRVQGKTAEKAALIVEHALGLEAAGACMLVLEAVPDRLAALITNKLTIPTIGIGAGVGCDGQVLVVHDMLGIRAGFSPKFVKTYTDLGELIAQAAKSYHDEVAARSFPAPEHTFTMTDEEYAKLLAIVGE
jgi:3-methyl-2-oxobutanoate hydroxymethyltransferase